MKTQSLHMIYSAQAHSHQKRAMDIMSKNLPSPISTCPNLSASRHSFQRVPFSPPSYPSRSANISRKISSQAPPCKIVEIFYTQAITPLCNSRTSRLLMIPISSSLNMASFHQPPTQCPSSTSASVQMASHPSTFSSSNRATLWNQQLQWCSLRETLCHTLSARQALIQSCLQNRSSLYSKRRKKRTILLSS